MRTESILKKAVAGLGSAALVIAMSACAHHDVAADQGYGQIRTEAPATADNSRTTVATVPAPVNTEGVATSPTPAVISGPAAVDNSGRAYTSSSAGGNGNASADRHEHEREPDPEEQQQLERRRHAVAGHGRDDGDDDELRPPRLP